MAPQSFELNDAGQLVYRTPVLPDDLPEAAQKVWRQLTAWRDSIIAKYQDPA